MASIIITSGIVAPFPGSDFTSHTSATAEANVGTQDVLQLLGLAAPSASFALC